MSIDALNWALRQEVKAPAKPVLVVLANHTNSEGESWPSYATIAFETGYSKSTVQGAVAELQAGGHLSKVPRRRLDGGHTTPLYRLAVEGGTRSAIGQCRGPGEAIPTAGPKPPPKSPKEPLYDPQRAGEILSTVTGYGMGGQHSPELPALDTYFQRIGRFKSLPPEKRIQAQAEARKFDSELRDGEGCIAGIRINDPLGFFVGRLQHVGIVPKKKKRKPRCE